MKKFLLFVSILIMLFTVSCKGANTDSPEKEDVTTTAKSPGESNTSGQPNNTDNPIVNPTVDLSVDYYYIGDMLFADSMDFSKWWFTNGTYPHSTFNGTIIKVEKVGRVRNPNKSTRMFRYSETLTGVERYETNQNWFYVEYANKYKVWVSKEFMNPNNKQYWRSETELINLENGNTYSGNGMVDGTWIKLTYSEIDNTYNFSYRDCDKAQYYN